MTATVTDSQKVGSATPANFLDSPTLTPTGSGKIIYALVASGASSPSDVTSVKYASTVGVGGESFTQLGTTLAVGANLKASLWRLVNPSAASGTVYGLYGGVDDERAIITVAVQDADSSGTPNGTVATATGSTSTPTVNVSSSSGQLVLDFLWMIDGGGVNYSITEGAGQTLIQKIDNGALGAPYEDAGSSKETAAGSSTTMSWSAGGGGGKDWGIFGLAVNDAAGGGDTLFGQALT